MRNLLAATAALAYLLQPASAWAQTCDMAPAFTRSDERGTVQRQVYGDAAGIALAFADRLKVNTDGTRISYNMDDPWASQRAINYLVNGLSSYPCREADPQLEGRPCSRAQLAAFTALREAGWAPQATARRLMGNVFEFGSDGTPCVTPDGYLVSMTSIGAREEHPAPGDCAQDKWLDALTVPTLVIPSGNNQFAAHGVRMRSLAAVYNESTGTITFAFVGDGGPRNELGEGSVALNARVNGLPAGSTPANYRDALNRFQTQRSVILFFRGEDARLAYPLTVERLDAEGARLLEAWGGAERLRSCAQSMQ